MVTLEGTTTTIQSGLHHLGQGFLPHKHNEYYQQWMVQGPVKIPFEQTGGTVFNSFFN